MQSVSNRWKENNNTIGRLLYVVSAAYFANANNNGNCNYNNASNEAGVRPVAGLLDFTTTQRTRPGAAL